MGRPLAASFRAVGSVISGSKWKTTRTGTTTRAPRELETRLLGDDLEGLHLRLVPEVVPEIIRERRLVA